MYATSSSNTYTKTFGGIDGSGKRLAEEVMQVVKKTQSLKRISFLAHSLGGLFAPYAIAVLYSPNNFTNNQPENIENSKNVNLQTGSSSRRGTIAGLDPINFITLSTPDLGVRGKRQVFSDPYTMLYNFVVKKFVRRPLLKILLDT